MIALYGFSIKTRFDTDCHSNSRSIFAEGVIV